MELAGLWHQPLVVAIANHLWQSTLVAFVAWLLTFILKRNHATTRYWVWMIASIKFLVPFSLLMMIGEWLHPAIAVPIQSPRISTAMMKVTQPLSQGMEPLTISLSDTTIATPAPHHGSLFPAALGIVWLCGFLFFLFRWIRNWWAIRAAVRSASPMFLPAHVPVLSSSHLLEPGIFGIFRPVLLLPEKIAERLTLPQLRSVLAHEMCHVRRRDNLTAAIHMLVEMLFWFHPAVWWIESRLIEERERACDEAVLQSGNKAEVYAEGILNVCKSYVESPLACMSGVTGSDLKRRVVRIMTEQVARKLDLSRKLLLGVVGSIVVAIPVVFGLLHITQVRAQAAAPDLTGTWQGTLHAGQDLRTVIKIAKDGSGYKATLYSIDQGGRPIPVKTVTQDGSNIKLAMPAIGGSYEGKLSSDGNTITGTVTQGSPMPLVLTKATPETAWTIPTPPPPIPPMDANASPSFEVATIKPTKPDERRSLFTIRGRQFIIVNQSLSSMISFAYGVHAKQVLNLPPWAASDKFDVDGVPDAEGMPNDKQLKGMLQKLLANRFQLKFHQDKKELPVYVLSVAKDGPKLAKSEGNPNGLPGLFFRQLGRLNVRNANMKDLTQLLQGVVLDRPVLDQTGLTGRFDFTLNWTPDDSQFGGAGARIPPPTDGSTAPPNLYTAIQEQIGLKLDATKALAEVMVVDHVEKPSAN